MKRFLLILVAIGIGVRASGESEVKVFSLATGETLVFPFQDGVPKPSESEWTICSEAGPSFVPEGFTYRLNWVVVLTPKVSLAALRAVSRVTIQEVSGAKAVTLFAGPPEFTDDSLLISAPAQLVGRQQYPWLYSSSGSTFVLRVQLERPGATPDILLQPVLIGPEVKKQLKDRGYLP